jgi:hypothetical protein
MNLGGRSRRVRSESSIKSPCGIRVSGEHRSLISVKASRLARWTLGCAAFSALAACQQSSSGQTTANPVTGSGAMPAVTLVATKSSVVVGTRATLQWNAKDAQTCAASGGWSGAQPTSGTATTDPLTATTSYTLTCSGAGGSASQSAEVVVTSPAPTVTLSASPTTIANGGTSTLSWNSADASACTASGGWQGSVATSGTSSTSALANTTEYQLTCTGAGGSATQSATVTVSALPPVVTLAAVPSTVTVGTASTLSWSAQNAASCSASGAWSGPKALSGSQSTDVLAGDATYTLSCSGPGGTAVQSAKVSKKSPTPVVSLSVGPSAISSGSSATLNWSSTHATSCIASGAWLGATALSGSRSTGALTATSTYTLTCTGAGGSAAQSATVSVKPAAPTVSLAASPSSVISGSGSALTWSAANATSCLASGAWSGSKAISGSQSTGALSANATYTLTCSGAGGTAAQSTTVTVSPNPTATVRIAASPSTVASGGSSTLTWSSTNATACTASGGWSGSKAISGSQSSGALTAGATYTLTCTGTGGSATQSTTVSVTAAAPTVSLVASPSTIASGSSSMLSWTSTNATSCTASGGWSGSQPMTGSQSTGALKANGTYGLTCTGSGGSATQSATVSVTSPAPTVTFAASPSTVASGGNSTLTWSAANATSCTASGAWSGSMAASGSQSTGALTTSKTYGLTCTGAGGSASQSATVSVTQAAPAVTLSANPSTLSSGATSTLSWSSTNATSCIASGGWGGSQAISGSTATPALTGTTKFTLTCTGAGGSATQSTTVTVSAAPPSVSLNANPTSVANGGSSTLTWSTTNATACTASGAWGGAQPVNGTQSTGALSSNATYTLTCTGAGGTATQSATVTVNSTPPPTSASCTGSSGSLNLKVNAVRGAGISPFLVFFDATGTTDSSITGNTTAFQDVSYSWDFGDTGASGTGTWAYGSNPGHNSRNSAIGGVAAHLYVTPGVDTAYVVTVTAHNGSSTASCQLGVTAYDPAGANGFAGTNTTCVSASGTPTPGAGGCPAGAATLTTSSFNTALGSHMGSGKRVLFKCGDTFSGDSAMISGTRWSVGAYGGCEGTQTNRPILSDSGSGGELYIAVTAGDGRVADLDLEGNGRGAVAVAVPAGTNVVPYQLTLSNLLSNGNSVSYTTPQGAQVGIVESVMTSMRSIGVFINNGGNNPATWSGPFPADNYEALLGNSFNGVGAGSGAGIETVRIAACRFCVIENNTLENANYVGAVLKLHNGNPSSTAAWTGVYTELVEISDNLFTGTSGAQLVETAPQNSTTDERLRNIVVERNVFSPAGAGGRQLQVSAVNETVRDNVFHSASSSQSAFGVQAAQRGIEPVPSAVEVYNNTCDQVQMCVALDGVTESAPANNSYAKNNLNYNPAGGTTVSNTGSGNAVSNNTVSPTSNPGFVNGSGTFSILSDFKPTANYLGGTTVPVYTDALGVVWSSSWELGAVSN